MGTLFSIEKFSLIKFSRSPEGSVLLIYFFIYLFYSFYFILLFLFNFFVFWLLHTYSILLTHFIVVNRRKGSIYVVICKHDLEKTFFYCE